MLYGMVRNNAINKADNLGLSIAIPAEYGGAIAGALRSGISARDMALFLAALLDAVVTEEMVKERWPSHDWGEDTIVDIDNKDAPVNPPAPETRPKPDTRPKPKPDGGGDPPPPPPDDDDCEKKGCRPCTPEKGTWMYEIAPAGSRIHGAHVGIDHVKYWEMHQVPYSETNPKACECFWRYRRSDDDTLVPRTEAIGGGQVVPGGPPNPANGPTLGGGKL